MSAPSDTPTDEKEQIKTVTFDLPVSEAIKLERLALERSEPQRSVSVSHILRTAARAEVARNGRTSQVYRTKGALRRGRDE